MQDTEEGNYRHLGCYLPSQVQKIFTHTLINDIMVKFYIHHISVAIIGMILITSAMTPIVPNHSESAAIVLTLVGSSLVISSFYNFVANEPDDFDIGRYHFWTVNLLTLLTLGWIGYQCLK